MILFSHIIKNKNTTQNMKKKQILKNEDKTFFHMTAVIFKVVSEILKILTI